MACPLQGLACIVSRIRNGRLDDRFKPLLLSCWLVGVPKPDGGTRPIAVGESLYKMAAFHALKSVAGSIPPVLGTSQFAFLPGGSETAGLLLKALSEASLMFAVDLRNAFNSVDRAMMLEALYAERDLSPLFRLVDFAYSASSDLLLRDRDNLLCSVVQSRNGTRQGDPLGMLLFCLAIKAPIATALASTSVPIRVVAVADDVTFVGPADGAAVATAVGVFRRECAARGLRFATKCKTVNFTAAPLDQSIVDLSRDVDAPIVTTAVKLLGNGPRPCRRASAGPGEHDGPQSL